TASVTTDSTGSGLGGVVTWNYSVAAGDVEIGRASRRERVKISVDAGDGKGSKVQGTGSVTITGTNDAPIVSATDVTGTVTELVSPVGNLTDSGTIAFTDVGMTEAPSVGGVRR